MCLGSHGSLLVHIKTMLVFLLWLNGNGSISGALGCRFDSWPGRHSRLRIWHRHSCGIACKCSSDLIPGQGTPYDTGRPKIEKKKKAMSTSGMAKSRHSKMLSGIPPPSPYTHTHTHTRALTWTHSLTYTFWLNLYPSIHLHIASILKYVFFHTLVCLTSECDLQPNACHS